MPSPLLRLFLPAIAALPLLSATSLLADVTLPPFFSRGAILQREQPIPVWGKADPGEAVSVTLGDKTEQTTADANGHWKVTLPPLPAGGGPLKLTVNGNNQIVLTDILMGEVWIASGQSNMEYRLKVNGPADNRYVIEAEAEIQAAKDPLLRTFNVNRKALTEPAGSTEMKGGPWLLAVPQSAGQFSAVAYHFAKELRQKLDVPVGIIHASWGGTTAQAWTSLPVLKGNPELAHYIQKRQDWIDSFPEADRVYTQETVPAWEAAVKEAEAAQKTPPRRPPGPMGPHSPSLPGNLFNAMIHPLIPYSIRGVIWYQGEANATQGKEYRTLFRSLITDWRARWQQGDFPFLYVQLANYRAPQTEPIEPQSWALLREAQLLTLSLPETGMASAIDLADKENPGDIHPHNKKDVGLRLALNALAKVYKTPVASYSGPLYSSMNVEKGKIRLRFAHTDGGLKADGEKLLGFAIAGKDKRFVWADAIIDGDSVLVSSADIAEPVAVRYGWAMNPIGNLYNAEGLPASPFRTDVEADQ